MILAFKVNIQGIYFVVISTQEPHFALEIVCMGENNQFLHNVYIEMRRFKIISWSFNKGNNSRQKKNRNETQN